MANKSEHGWSAPRVAAFFRAHPERAPLVSSWVPQGWDEPVGDALIALLGIELTYVTAIRLTQIKEKFGGLRIYLSVDEDSVGEYEIVKSTETSTHIRNAATPGSIREQAHAIIDQAVGADPNLSHRANRILSQGWKPTLRWSAVDKCSSWPGSLTSLVPC